MRNARLLFLLPLLVVLSLGTAGPLSAQSVTFTPSSGSGTAGQPFGVTIKFCDAPPQYYLSHYMTFNGQDVTGNFSQSSGEYDPSCTFLMYWYGTVTLQLGQNTLEAGFTDYFFDGADQYWTSGGYGSTNYTGDAPPPPPAPDVTPHNELWFVSPATGILKTFNVRNVDTQSRTFTLSPSCSGSASSCVLVGSSSIVLGAGQSGSVNVTFTVSGALNASGTVVLGATEQSGGQYASGQLSVKVAPSGPVIARDLCLTIAAGPSAAYECGDLRLVHTLPSVRTLGQTRTPTLTYNSQHAYPVPIVYQDVTLPSGQALPNIVVGRLSINGQVFTETFAGSQWGSPGQSRRMMVPFSAPSFATDIYPYTLEVQRDYGSGPVTYQTFTGALPVVNRMSSPFGAGWWLAGFEQLIATGSGQFMWVGGDGSVRRYEPVGGNAFVATPVDAPDSLFYDPGTAQYTRKLKAGGRVVFSSTGFHLRTINRVGYSTEFAQDGACPRLASLTVPPSNSGLTYFFDYSGGCGMTLSAVRAPDTAVAPAFRVTTIGQNSGRIQYITDPGASAAVQFHFHESYLNIITYRTDRRGNHTWFGYGSALRLSVTSQLLNGGINPVRNFCPSQTRGLSSCAPSLPHPDTVYTVFDGPRSVTPSSTPDSTDIFYFQDRPLGVERIIDPYGYLTSVSRTDMRWPALATRMASPNGRILGATFDGRGNLASVTDSNRYFTGDNPTTTYVYEGAWDQPTLITHPNGQLLRFGIDGFTGNQMWVEDGRGSSSRTNISYVTSGNPGAGLVRLITPPGLSHLDGNGTSLQYNSLGNVFAVVEPILAVPTALHYQDRLGRTINTVTPAGSGGRQDSTHYDARDRIIRTASYGPAMNGAPAQLQTVRNFYDDEDNLYRVERSQAPNPTGLSTLVTQWLFDQANRPIREIAPDGYRDSTWYDPAGNAIGVSTRRNHTLTMVYDRLNRLRRRDIPDVTYPVRSQGIGTFSLLNWGVYPYPFFPNSGTGLTIAGGAETFWYDEVGNLVAADNADAWVRRKYLRDGRVSTDSLWIRDYGSSTFSHAYGLRYAYDLNGRLSVLKHPSQLAGVADSVRYVYHAQSGELTDVFDPLGRQFRFVYSQRGELVRTDMPGGIADSLVYDLMGRLTQNRIANNSTSPYKAADALLRNTALSYADHVRVSAARNAAGWTDTSTALYSGLTHLVNLQYIRPYNNAWGVASRQTSTEQFNLDALANVHQTILTTSNIQGTSSSSSSTSWQPSTYVAQTGRQATYADPYRTHAFVYDSAGNSVFRYQSGYDWYYATQLEDNVSWYGADGRLRVAEWRKIDRANPNGYWPGAPWWMVFEEYRYDALGRRVLVRDRRECWAPSNEIAPCNRSRIRRTVWDGPRELWEIQMPGRSTDNLENDVSVVMVPRGFNYGTFDPNPLYGRVAYTYAGGVDRPLSITRYNLVDYPYGASAVAYPTQTLAPHWNYRGQPDFGTFGDGGVKTCLNASRCVKVLWRHRAFAYAQEMGFLAEANGTPFGWFGTLIFDKEDGTGTVYRRNRYIDPTTGRFTQEDPIGLAGGTNLYGFGSDPVNYADPFGLNPLPAIGVFIARFWRPIAAAIGIGRAAARNQTVMQLADDVVAATRRLTDYTGARVMDVGRRIGELRVGQEKAVQAIETAIDRFAQRGVTVTIDGVRYIASRMGNIDQGVSAIGVGADGSTTKAVIRLGQAGWEVVRTMGTIPVQ